MGWKASCIFASATSLNIFSQEALIKHDPDKAKLILKELKLSNYECRSLTTFDLALYPKENHLAIGAYEGGAIICERSLPAFLFDEQSRRRIIGKSKNVQNFTNALFHFYPKGEVLGIILHSAVNLWAYSFYVDGRLIRSVAGSADDRLLVDSGLPLAEEKKILSGHPMRAICEKDLGEELVMEVSRRIFGGRMDDFNRDTLKMTLYEKTPSFWSRIFR